MISYARIVIMELMLFLSETISWWHSRKSFQIRHETNSYGDSGMESKSVAYEELADAWVKIEATLMSEEQSEDWRQMWINRVFCEVLGQCGWSVNEWNAEVARRKVLHDAESEQ